MTHGKSGCALHMTHGKNEAGSCTAKANPDLTLRGKPAASMRIKADLLCAFCHDSDTIEMTGLVFRFGNIWPLVDTLRARQNLRSCPGAFYRIKKGGSVYVFLHAYKSIQ